jgi:hypothetical protein
VQEGAVWCTARDGSEGPFGMGFSRRDEADVKRRTDADPVMKRISVQDRITPMRASRASRRYKELGGRMAEAALKEKPARAAEESAS